MALAWTVDGVYNWYNTDNYLYYFKQEGVA